MVYTEMHASLVASNFLPCFLSPTFALYDKVHLIHAHDSQFVLTGAVSIDLFITKRGGGILAQYSAE